MLTDFTVLADSDRSPHEPLFVEASAEEEELRRTSVRAPNDRIDGALSITTAKPSPAQA